MIFPWLRQTAQPYNLQAYGIQYTTTVCNAGQQLHDSHTVTQDSSNQVQKAGGRLPETDGTKFLPTIRSGGPGHQLASIHQMAPPKRGGAFLIIALLIIYRPREDERLSWPSWLTGSGRLTRQLQVKHRTEEVRRRNTDVLPLCYATSQTFGLFYFQHHIYDKTISFH